MALALRRGFFLPNLQICNIAELVILSIYMQSADIWFSEYMQVLDSIKLPTKNPNKKATYHPIVIKLPITLRLLD